LERQPLSWPRLIDLFRPATIATKEIKPEPGTEGGRPFHVLRRPFIKQWFASTKPRVFIHRFHPGRLFEEAEFNDAVRPFSHVDATARLLKREVSAKVDSVAYEPGANAGVVTVEGQRCFNTWSPTRIERIAGDVKPWLDFLEHLIPNSDERAHVMRWIATLIARPAIRMLYGILLISDQQGVGKGTLMEKVLAPLVGWQNVAVPNEKQLTDSAFNSWLVRKRLVLVHEIYAGNSKKAYNTLKTYVTDKTLRVNEKNRPEYENNNWTLYVLSSNSFHALLLVENDRRWFVPEVTEQKKDPQYWIKFNAYLNGGGLEAIHAWAYDYVEEHSAVGEGDNAPTSAAKQKLIEESRSEGQKMVLDLGKSAMASEKSVVLSDRDVRSWLANARKLFKNDGELDLNHRHLESLWTVRKMLEIAGMRTVYDKGKIEGLRYVLLANAKGVEAKEHYAANAKGAEAKETAKAEGVEFWRAAKQNENCLTKPSAVVTDDKGNEDGF
jgi:hypothetical protein